MNWNDLFLIIGTYQNQDTLQKAHIGIRVLRANRETTLQFAPQGTADSTEQGHEPQSAPYKTEHFSEYTVVFKVKLGK